MRKLVLLLVSAVLVSALFPVAHAAPVAVVARDNAFEPAHVKVQVGQTVEWSNAPSARDAHNVKGDGKIFYSGFAGSVEFSFSRNFSAGTFHYFCEKHGWSGGGMDGTVKVPVKLASAPTGPAFTVAWATSSSNTGSRYTISYKVGSGAWKVWKSSTTALKATFNGAVSGTRYTFRAKSLDGDAASKWSPLASITA